MVFTSTAKWHPVGKRFFYSIQIMITLEEKVSLFKVQKLPVMYDFKLFQMHSEIITIYFDSTFFPDEPLHKTHIKYNLIEKANSRCTLSHKIPCPRGTRRIGRCGGKSRSSPSQPLLQSNPFFLSHTALRNYLIRLH